MQTVSTELLDIVDDDDQVIGTAMRGDIHRQGLKHRAVHILVFDGQGRVLLQKRSAEKDQCAGMWDTACAGHVECGQSYEETVPRELQEELGIAPENELHRLFKMRPTSDNGHEFAWVYSIEHQGPFTAAEDEIDELRWYTFKEVDNWLERMFVIDKQQHDLTSGFMEIWRRFREQFA